MEVAVGLYLMGLGLWWGGGDYGVRRSGLGCRTERLGAMGFGRSGFAE